MHYDYLFHLLLVINRCYALFVFLIFELLVQSSVNSLIPKTFTVKNGFNFSNFGMSVYLKGNLISLKLRVFLLGNLSD